MKKCSSVIEERIVSMLYSLPYSTSIHPLTPSNLYMHGHRSKLSCGMSVLLHGLCPQGKKVLLRSRSEPGIYADLRGDRTLDLFGVNEM